MYQYFILYSSWIILHCMNIHSWVDGHLRCFHFMCIINSAIMNIQVQGFLWIYVFIFCGYIHLGLEQLGHMVILCKATFSPAKNPWLLLLVTVLPSSLPFCCIISSTLAAVLIKLSISSSGPPLPRGEHGIHVLPITCPLPGIWFFGRESVRLKGAGTHASLSIHFLTSISQSSTYTSTFSNVEFYHILPLSSLISFLPCAGQMWLCCLHPPLASSGTLSFDQ